MNWKRVLKLTVAPAALAAFLVGCSDDGGRTVATIGEEKITESQLTERLYQQKGHEILDGMVNNKLVELEAEKLKLEVSDEEIAEEYKTYAANAGGEELLEQMLEQFDMKKEDIEEDIRLYLLTVKVLEDYVKLSDEDVKAYFEENKTYFDVPETIELNRIIVEDDATAKEVIAKLNEGEEFTKLAEEYSVEEVMEGVQAGLVGEVARGDLDETSEAAAFALAEGEYSKSPVKTEAGFEVFYVTKRTEAKEATFENSKEQARAQLMETKVNEAYEPWIMEKREEYEITTSLFE